MAWADILPQVKNNLNITLNVRDDYLLFLISGVVSELQEIQGLKLDENNFSDKMFVADYTAWRYRSRDKNSGSNMGNMPQNLYWRLKNLMLKSKVDENV